MSKVHCLRLKTSNIDNSRLPGLVNETDSDQYEDGENYETLEHFEYLSTSNSYTANSHL